MLTSCEMVSVALVMAPRKVKVDLHGTRQAWHFSLGNKESHQCLKDHTFSKKTYYSAKKIPNFPHYLGQEPQHRGEATDRLTSYHNQHHKNTNRGRSISPPQCCRSRLTMPRLLISQEDQRTHFVIWTLAVLCAILSIAVIIAGIAVFVVYMVYQPKMPYIRVAHAQLDQLNYDQFGLLEIYMTLNLEAVNDNNKAHTSFSALSFLLQFHDIDVAVLKSKSLEVPKNSSRPLNYQFHSSPIPLDQYAMEDMDKALRRGIVPFDLRGHAKTRWKVGIFASVRFWTHISCRLHFFQSNGSTVESGCSTTSH